jgi:hypothetical protein
MALDTVTRHRPAHAALANHQTQASQSQVVLASEQKQVGTTGTVVCGVKNSFEVSRGQQAMLTRERVAGEGEISHPQRVCCYI